jgi:hypothetical protein
VFVKGFLKMMESLLVILPMSWIFTELFRKSIV